MNTNTLSNFLSLSKNQGKFQSINQIKMEHFSIWRLINKDLLYYEKEGFLFFLDFIVSSNLYNCNNIIYLYTVYTVYIITV